MAPAPGFRPLAIIVAAVFWTTLWGPVGLLLATPLTVCLVVLGRHVPQLQFLEVLLGDQPVLAPEVKFYQRLLAGDPHEAEELAEDLLEERSLQDVLESMVLPALLFAEQDRQRGVLEPRRARELAASVTAIADDLVEPLDMTEPPAPSEAVSTPGRVLCVGTRVGLDAAAAGLLAQLLRARGFAAEVADAGSLLHGGPPAEPFDAVCLSLLDVTSPRYARRLLLRLRARLGHRIPACVCLWGSSPDELQQGLTKTQAEAGAASLGEAVTKTAELVAKSVAAPAAAPAALAAAS